MAATTIFFEGRLISIPDSYSTVDASGLEVVGIGASGIVACLGTAVGGKPYDEVDVSDTKGNLQVATKPQHPFDYYRSGDLREAGPILFSPSVDEDVPGGAQEIVYVKVNPSEPSTATFSNASGDALELTSKDYGWFTTQINVQIGSGTSQGKLITIVFEDVTESFDDVGGDDMFTIQYLATTPANGFTTITVAVTASAITAAFTADRAGLDGDVTNQVTATQVIELVSTDNGDTMNVTIYGTDTSNNAQVETVTLTGTTAKDTDSTWNSFHGAIIHSAPAGTVTLQNDGGGTVITTLTAGSMTKGLYALSDMSVAKSAVTVVRDAAGTERLTIVGTNSSGATQIEGLQLNGTTPVPGTATWSQLTYLAMGEVAAAGTVTASGNAVNAMVTGIDTLQKLADLFNGSLGFTLTLVTGETQFGTANLDYASATDVKSPAEPSFYADLYTIVQKLNNESDLVTAARSSGGTGAPDNTTAPVYLTGGNEGSSTPGQEATPYAQTTDWQAALNLLKKVRVNSIVLLTPNPAIHAMGVTHCQWMCGPGKSERDLFVGVMNTAMDGLATKTEIKAQIVDLNTRHCRTWAQNIQRYNTSGEKEYYDPQFGAAMLAGMQAGSEVGVPLTKKYANVLGLQQDSSWNPIDDAEEMIQAGLVFAEVVDGVGRRVVRNVTTHLSTSNIAYTEGSVNEALNYSVYNYRTALERIVGKRGFSGNLEAARGVAIDLLSQLVGVSLVAWRSLTLDLTLDVLETEVEMAPVLPINFVKSTVHAVTVAQSAAAA
jgi:hypothetical protein